MTTLNTTQKILSKKLDQEEELAQEKGKHLEEVSRDKNLDQESQ